MMRRRYTRMNVLVLVLVLVLALARPRALCVQAEREAIAWVCLERCNDNIAADIASLRKHAGNLTGVSYEAFDLGVNGTLIDNGFTRLESLLEDLGLESYPMITTVDIWRIRQVFARPAPFFAAVVAALRSRGVTGVNVDWEPCQFVRNCAKADGAAYAQFLQQFAKALHSHGFSLSVDVASWTPFWNFDLLAKSSAVDRIISMDTYATSMQEFSSALQAGVATFGPRFGAGLCDSCAPKPGLTPAQIDARFKAMEGTDTQLVAVWDWPVPDWWWEYVGPFVEGSGDT